MLLKHSWLQYKKMMVTNKLAFLHVIIIIPGVGLGIYYIKDSLVFPMHSKLSHIIFFLFLLQTSMIVAKRVKNEFFFSLRNYVIYPQKKHNIFLYTLVFGVVDFNVIIYFIVSLGVILYVTNWSLTVKVAFLFIFVLCEIAYLIYMMLTIEIMTERYGSNKNLFMLTFIPFLFLEQYTRFAEKFYLFDYYPISGWIGSTTSSAVKGDIVQILLYFCITISTSLIGLIFFKKIMFPRKYNVF